MNRRWPIVIISTIFLYSNHLKRQHNMRPIQLYIENGIRPQVELCVNSGVMAATNEMAPAGAYYRTGAFLPKSDWVKTSYDEKQWYDAATADHYNTVGVYGLSDVIIDLIHELG